MASQESMPPVQQPQQSDDVSRIRDEYRQSVLDLCHEYSSTQIAWDVSQHFLDKIWNSSPENNDSNGNRGSSSHKGATPATVFPESGGTTATVAYACQSCGYRLHPGWNGTTLRVKRPNPPPSPSAKRTLRRRELRKRKKAARAEEMKAKDHRNKRGRRATVSGPSSGSMAAEGASPRQKLVLLRDDPGIGRLERHRMVVTCGRCKDKTYLKGLRRGQQEQQQQQRLQTPKTKQETANARASQDLRHGAGDLSENFERLPELAKKPPPTSNSIEKSPPGAPMSLLEQKMGLKKKKKKKKGAGNNQSGNLLNFLGSLNDH